MIFSTYTYVDMCSNQKWYTPGRELVWRVCRTGDSTISQISSQIFRIPPTEYTRVTNAPFYDGDQLLKKKKKKEK